MWSVTAARPVALVLVLAVTLETVADAGSSTSLRSKRQAIQFGDDRRAVGGRGSSGEPCKDYLDRPGTCGPLEDCPALRQLLSGGRRSPQRVQNLRDSLCGFQQGGTPQLCCASTTPPTPRPTPEGRDPERHPNRRLLPQDLRCGLNIEDKLTGGVEALQGKYPWLAILGYSVTNQAALEYNCGGALINERYVLTAAHCVTDLPSDFKLAQIRLGEHNISSNPDCTQEGDCVHVQDFTAERVIPHADYHKPNRFWNDIALIRLNRPARFEAFVSPLCLPFGPTSELDFTGNRLWTAGFGLTEAFGEASEVLMELRVPVFDQSRCSAVFARRGAVIGAGQMCAGGEQGRDTCAGDSGGPLMYAGLSGPPYFCVGIVSFGLERCGSKDIPGVYTRVAPYLNWVLDNISP